MAELATIARPYAEALFQACQADLDAASVWIQELAAIATSTELQALAANPNVTTQQVYDLVLGVAPEAAQTEAGKNLLHTVLENKRLAALPEIAAQFMVLKNQKGGFYDAIVHSPYPLGSDALSDLKNLLEVKFKRKLILRVEIDEQLIAGVRVVVGDEVLDTSVKARLDQMKAALVG
jgi:F-type H+-transporting ATPase subunit delta